MAASKPFILSDELLSYLIWEEEYNNVGPGAPTSSLTQEEVDDIISQLPEKTMAAYCKWRWPDNEEEQYLIALQSLVMRGDPKEGTEYAVVTLQGKLVNNLTYDEARDYLRKSYTTKHQHYIVPKEFVTPCENCS